MSKVLRVLLHIEVHLREDRKPNIIRSEDEMVMPSPSFNCTPDKTSRRREDAILCLEALERARNDVCIAHALKRTGLVEQMKR